MPWTHHHILLIVQRAVQNILSKMVHRNPLIWNFGALDHPLLFSLKKATFRSFLGPLLMSLMLFVLTLAWTEASG